MGVSEATAGGGLLGPAATGAEGGAGAGGGIGAQADSNRMGRAMMASFAVKRSLPSTTIAVVPRAALRGAGEPADQAADRGSLAGVAAENPADDRPAGGAGRGAAQGVAIRRAGRRPVIAPRRTAALGGGAGRNPGAP